MNIIFLIWNYYPGLEGGSERQARKTAQELVSRGHKCEVWTAWLEARFPRQEMLDGVMIHRFGRYVPFLSRCQQLLMAGHVLMKKVLNSMYPRSTIRYETFRQRFDFWVLLIPTWVARRSFMQEILEITWGRRPSADVIHLHEPSWLGGFAVWMADPWRIPVICQEATNPVLPILGYDVPCRKKIGRWRNNSIFIAMAPYLAKDLLAKGISAGRVHLLPNGVNIPAFSAEPNGNGPVLYVGNFSQGTHLKAFDVLFEAWGIVHKVDSLARLVVLGGGDSSPWQQFVVQKGCASSVEFKGRVDDPSPYYRNASVFVLPSRVEGMSNALLEAQSWGLPCVVSDIPGNQAIVEDGINGLVVPVDNAQELATALLKLLQNKLLRSKFGQAASNKMKAEYDIDCVMTRLEKIYAKVADNNSQ